MRNGQDLERNAAVDGQKSHAEKSETYIIKKANVYSYSLSDWFVLSPVRRLVVWSCRLVGRACRLVG